MLNFSKRQAVAEYSLLLHWDSMRAEGASFDTENMSGSVENDRFLVSCFQQRSMDNKQRPISIQVDCQLAPFPYASRYSVSS